MPQTWTEPGVFIVFGVAKNKKYKKCTLPFFFTTTFHGNKSDRNNFIIIIFVSWCIPRDLEGTHYVVTDQSCLWCSRWHVLCLLLTSSKYDVQQQETKQLLSPCSRNGMHLTFKYIKDMFVLLLLDMLLAPPMIWVVKGMIKTKSERCGRHVCCHNNIVFGGVTRLFSIRTQLFLHIFAPKFGF